MSNKQPDIVFFAEGSDASENARKFVAQVQMQSNVSCHLFLGSGASEIDDYQLKFGDILVLIPSDGDNSKQLDLARLAFNADATSIIVEDTPESALLMSPEIHEYTPTVITGLTPGSMAATCYEGSLRSHGYNDIKHFPTLSTGGDDEEGIAGFLMGLIQ